VSAMQQFRLNSVYDPNLNIAGHQPLGYDTWSVIYNYYKVLECNITVEIIQPKNED
jgi:hypothetical protein